VSDVDEKFYDRADAHIHLSNCGWNKAKEMAEAKEETIEYFVTEYRKMLEENLDDYINNFESYMRPSNK
jgi:hypothetical protein